MLICCEFNLAGTSSHIKLFEYTIIEEQSITITNVCIKCSKQTFKKKRREKGDMNS